ncbi:tumor necrosis factor receptor superfamily member 16 [Leptonychotes weddellii]|uniref:Tumor necrosis factor receptor superfamily member 16 n=1 Tax=Leptonychotes weddellii TaxID=9713 RepID=A0A7F8PX64_LEPWE|nr:tumor necrosis factor receptor superfamily member 16 [Leptonychotes weddellii]
MDRPRLLLLLLLLLGVSLGSAKEACPTGLYTHSGECCKACNLGEGVAQPCGANQTVCEPCLDRLSIPAGCPQPQLLPSGHGLSALFLPRNLSSLPGVTSCLLPGTHCLPGGPLLPPEIPGRWITRSTPSEGSDSTAPSTEEPEGPPEQDVIASTVADVVTTVMGSSQPVVTRGTTDNLIPVYCSILAAVVVGLVAYIAFKRWNSCKQNKQGANSRPANQTPPPEGEKLHSDSGISVDSQSLHDQQPHTQTAAGQALKGDGGLYSSLPPAKREEVEKLLNGSAGDTWRHLAGELGYQPEHIDSFTHEACPVRALLASWAAQDSATLDALLAALRRIQRADIVESLCSESTATSPV